MSELHDLLSEALLNNSYDHKSMDKSLKRTWHNSYSYLYALQKHRVEYEEFHYKSNDIDSRDITRIGKLYLDSSWRACFDVAYDPIHICNREEYRRSKFYKKEITIDDISANPYIFKKIPIVIIDNQVIWDYKMKIFYKDGMAFRLPYRRSFVLKNERNLLNEDIIYQTHNVQVIIIDNIFYERKAFTSRDLLINEKKEVTWNTSQLLSKRVRSKKGLFFCSFYFPSKNKSYGECTELLPCISNDDNILFSPLSNTLYEKIVNSNETFFVSFVFIDELIQHTFYGDDVKGSTEIKITDSLKSLIIIQKDEFDPYELPIPVENCMIFKKNSGDDSFHLEKNTDILELHYPNIYVIVDKNIKSGDEYRVFYFYHPMIDFRYTPIHEFYYRFLSIHFGERIEYILNRIYRDEIDYGLFTEEQTTSFKDTFSKIISYHYFNHQYGEIDFLKRYKQISGNENKTPFEYKENTLKEWMKIDPKVLRDYVIEQNKLSIPVYHLYTKTMDLSERLRNDTKNEFGPRDGITFQSPRYLFTFRNEKELGAILDCRVYVDGLFVQNLYQKRKGWLDYLYIPSEMVTTDSYIEIEIFPTYEFKKEILFTSMDQEEEITLLEPENDIYPTVSDLYFLEPGGETKRAVQGRTKKNDDPLSIDEDNLITIPVTASSDYMWISSKSANPGLFFKIYDDNFFKIISVYKEGEFEVKTVDPEKPIKFTRLKTFKIKPASEEILNINMECHISKIPNGMEVMIENDGYPYLALVGVERNFKFNNSYIRIYHNGRLIPKVKYVFFSTYVYPRIQLLEPFKAGDMIYIDITPYRYQELYYQEELEKGQQLIDLRGVIDKPFDIRYYDVFVNCRKMSLNSIFAISPWQITLVNLKSIYNIQIFEKERDWEYFGLDYNENIYYYSIDDLFKSNFITEDEKNRMIKQIIDETKEDTLTIYPNTNEEEKRDFTDLRVFIFIPAFYYNELIPKTYVNPDRLQFSKRLIWDEYTSIAEYYFSYPGAKDECRNDEELKYRKLLPNVVMLDPDIIIEGKNGKGTQHVFCVGHPTTVDQSLLDENIDLKNDSNIGGDR